MPHDLALKRARIGGKAAVMAFLNIVPAVLKNPTAIFEGLRERTYEERGGDTGLCYIGKPKVFYVGETGAQIPFPPNEIYCIYVNDDKVVFDWRAERASEDDNTLPMKHNTRYTRRIL